MEFKKETKIKNQPIDIVLYWLDDKDPCWRQQKERYSRNQPLRTDISNVRYESWDNLHLWFRAIETCMPWFHKIFLVTCGQRPSFLVQDHPKLVMVDHSDYIPKKYLPTFNSSTIEMNLHRIEELSENYILFNDDMFPIEYNAETYYFQDDTVCDEAVENVIVTGGMGAVTSYSKYAQVNCMVVINRHFHKREVQAAHPEQWFNEAYEERLERTKACAYWNDFPGFYDPHVPSALKKSTLAHLWEIEYETLDRASRNRFRDFSDVTQYLIRYWQLCTGNFLPRKTRGKVFFPKGTDIQPVVDAIRNRTYPMICFNEYCTPEEFPVIKQAVNQALQERFPNKSSFERA